MADKKWYKAAAALACVAFLGGGCGVADGDDASAEASYLGDGAFEAGKGDGSGLAVTTQNLNASQWLGYDKAFDRVSPNPCVQVDDARMAPTEPRFRIPTLRVIQTRQQLAEELGIDLKGGGSLDVAKAEIGFNLLNEFSRSSDKVAFLLRVTEDYAVLRRQGDGASVRLTERARGLLESGDLNAFASECGSHFINGVRYGASIDVLITFSSDDQRSLQQLNASVGAQAAGVPAELDASLKRSMEEKSQNLDISIATSASGFSLAVPADEIAGLGVECRDVARTIGDHSAASGVDSLLADLVTQQPDALPRLFAHIDCLKELMHHSLATDAELCRTEGECTLTNAAPREVILEEYRAAEASDLVEQLATVEAERRRLAVELEDLGAMRVRTRSAYWDEIAPFVSAEHAQKATFVVAHRPEFADLPTLQSVANQAADLFAPDPQRPGTIERDLTRLIDDCRARASNDLHHTCIPQGTLIEQDPTYAAAEEALRFYEAQNRLVPLQVVIAPEAMRYSIPGVEDALEFCESLGPGYRLPRVDELRALDLLVDAGPVPNHTMWHSDDADECSLSGAFYDPASGTSDCSSVGAHGTVCVSPGGIYPTLKRL